MHICSLFGGSRCPSRRYQSHTYRDASILLVFCSGFRTSVHNWNCNQHIWSCFRDSRRPSQGSQTDIYTPVFGTFSITRLKRNPHHNPNTLGWNMGTQPLVRRSRCHKYKRDEVFSSVFLQSCRPHCLYFEQTHTQQVLIVE